MHKGRPTLTRPRYYLYIEPLKGGVKCTEEGLTDAGLTVADTTGAGGTDMSDPIKIMEYAFNPAKLVDSLYFKNGDNYRMHKAIANTNIPVWSWWSGAKVAKMEDAEQLRYVSDLAKNTGIDPSNWKYPIRMGYYGNAGSYGSVFSNTNRGIMNLYKTATYKKPEINIHNHRHISNYGDYYRYGDFNNNNYYR